MGIFYSFFLKIQRFQPIIALAALIGDKSRPRPLYYSVYGTRTVKKIVNRSTVDFMEDGRHPLIAECF